MTTLRTASTVCFLLAVPLMAFACWGLHTVAGQHAFDEMAGIVPFAAGVLSAVLAACAVITWWLGR